MCGKRFTETNSVPYSPTTMLSSLSTLAVLARLTTSTHFRMRAPSSEGLAASRKANTHRFTRPQINRIRRTRLNPV